MFAIVAGLFFTISLNVWGVSSCKRKDRSTGESICPHGRPTNVRSSSTVGSSSSTKKPKRRRRRVRGGRRSRRRRRMKGGERRRRRMRGRKMREGEHYNKDSKGIVNY